MWWTWTLKPAKDCQGNVKISTNGEIQVEEFALLNFNPYTIKQC